MSWPILVLDHLYGMFVCAQWLSDWPSTSTSCRISLKVSGSQVTPQRAGAFRVDSTAALITGAIS